MDLQHWQAEFENWLKNHHQHQDAAHDVCHFRRVWATAQKLAADDDVDMLVILTACYFHDIVSLAKNHPQRQRSSILAAEETRRLLREEFVQFPAEKIEAVCHAIAAHSFSAQIAPLTTEAKIVQDADRLEALGAIAGRPSYDERKRSTSCSSWRAFVRLNRSSSTKRSSASNRLHPSSSAFSRRNAMRRAPRLRLGAFATRAKSRSSW